MKRESSPLGSSRLYPQAQEGSSILLEMLSEDVPDRYLQREIFDSDSVAIGDVAESRVRHAVAVHHVAVLAAQIDPELGLPILLESVGHFYKNVPREHAEWIGLALKTAVAFLWRGVWRPSATSRSRSLRSLEQLVRSAGLILQLQGLESIFAVTPNGSATLLPNAITGPNDYLTTIREHHSALGKPWTNFRTMQHSIHVLVQGHAGLAGIHSALEGEDPSTIGPFEGTIFGLVPPRSSPDFWVGLTNRVVLYQIARELRSIVGADGEGLSVLEDMAVLSAFSTDRRASFVELNGQDSFWKRPWYDMRMPDDATNMIVERPVLRVTEQRSIYVTTPSIVLDSINWYVESAVFGYPHGGPRLPEIVFQRGIAAAFEERVRDRLKKLFNVGAVTADGVWRLPSGSVQLTNPDAPCPGEIDVLASNATRKITCVGECKVLGMPRSPSGLRNVFSKIGADDAELFHAKLRRKVEWVQGCSRFRDHDVGGAIILDHRLPGMARTAEFPVIDDELLVDFFRNHLAVRRR